MGDGAMGAEQRLNLNDPYTFWRPFGCKYPHATITAYPVRDAEGNIIGVEGENAERDGDTDGDGAAEKYSYHFDTESKNLTMTKEITVSDGENTATRVMTLGPEQVPSEGR